jgi:hypothetical protein
MPFLARLLRFATIASVALISACGGGGGGGGGGVPVTDAGFFKAALTDAAACGYNQINVTPAKVRVNASATAADGDPGWWEIAVLAKKIDLLSLTNGAVLELGQVQVPVGTYRQLSLVLDTTAPLGNSVVPVVGAETALGMPAALQGNLKIPVNIAVVKDQTSDYVIDFDACNSVLRLGNSGNYDLSARLSVVQRLAAPGQQQVTGFVDKTLNLAATRVSLQSSGSVVRSTSPDSNGHFILYPVPPGTYDLVISALGTVPAVVTGVTVSPTASTDVNTAGTPINPPSSPSNTISGTVATPGTTPIDARVAIVKKYTGGPNVTIAGAPADGTTGGLLYTVPTAAPVRAPYVAGITPLVFSPDNATPTGRYTVAVIAKGTLQTTDVDATANNPIVAFTFP